MTIANANNAEVYLTITAAGTYVFRLTVTDDDELTGTDDMTLVVSPVAGLANYNYIRETTLRTEVTDTAAITLKPIGQKTISMTYFDGLGRPMQQVQQQASPAGKDLVVPIEYDLFGREVKKYLPYADPGSANGDYRPGAVTAQNAFYTTPPSGVVQISSGAALSQTVPELSPLNRVLEQGAPGAAWQAGSGHTVRTEYKYNNTTAPGQSDSRLAALYTVAIASNGARSLARENNSAVYAANQLSVTITKDENWSSGKGGTTEEYKDKNGQVVLKRTYNVKGGNTEILSTYYVYDDLGYLSFVLTPGANPDAASAISAAVLNNYCYQYRYDERGRLVEKKLPGKGVEYMVYNALDQVTATQDANQRAKSNPEWSFMKYDALGRNIGSGVWVYNTTTAISRADLQTLVNQNSTLWESGPSVAVSLADVGYSDQAFPASGQGSSRDWQMLSYYDRYEHLDLAGLRFDQTTDQDSIAHIKGLAAASKVRILDTNTWLLSASYYNDKGELIQSQAMNNLAGKDAYYTSYNFAGQPTSKQRKHYKSSLVTSALNIHERFEYDAAGRLSQHYHQAGDQPEISLAAYTYNELGQLHKKTLHENGVPVPQAITIDSALSTGQSLSLVASSSITLSDGFYVPEGATFTARIQSTSGGDSGPGLGSPKQQYIAYTYNERGWLKSINDPDNVTDSTAFGMKLYYNDGTLAQYNGNISRMDWQTKVPGGYSLTQEKQSFEYSYDKLNRLTKADYVTTGSAGKFNEELNYDLMGNIVALKRANSMSGYLNDLSYNYTNNGESGNQLWSITDDVNGGGISSAYTYDVNGNMRTDSRKGITIEYNRLNLPKVVNNSTETLSYTYDASGRKLKKSLGTDIRDYADGIEYSNGEIEFIQTAEGRIIPGDGSSYTYEYMLKDHLGNTRAAVKQDGSIVQVQDYYAFGLPFNANNQVTPSPDNAYKYNGKEWNAELSLNAYDYGARFYDPLTGRFTTIDPSADEEDQESWSPYHYVYNNPIRHTDPDGRIPVPLIGAAVGALTDIAIQSLEIAMDDNKSFSKDFSGKSVLVSAVAGATGAGLVSKLGKLGTVARIGVELAHDAAAAAAGQYATEGKVNGKTVAASAVFGKAAGDVAGKTVAKQVAKTPAAKLLAKDADRAGRVAANGPRASRTAAANAAAKKAEGHVNSRAAAAGTASSGVGGRAAERILDDEKKKR